MTQQDGRRSLRDAALRVTAPRLAVLDAVQAHPHASTETVIRLVREELPDVSHQTVYDVLRVLSAARLVRRIEPPGSVPRYESRVGDNHHHAVCRGCGAITDVDCVVGEPPCMAPSRADGFAVDEAEVIFWGLCAACSTTP